MIRPARTTEVFELGAILCEQHGRSRYAHTTTVDEHYTRRLLAQAVQRHGGTHDGASFVMVSETTDGKVQGFVLGVLDRLYHIMEHLRAQDMFLVASTGASPLVTRALLNSYLDWACAIPAVHEVYLSHTDVLPEGDRMGRIYERLGFARCGAIYRRETSHSHVRIAA